MPLRLYTFNLSRDKPKNDNFANAISRLLQDIAMYLLPFIHLSRMNQREVREKDARSANGDVALPPPPHLDFAHSSDR